ncbi:hypothetical protein HH308_03650 [Gordonia sp. TBRC 11910]|uniref:Uncharacterized protein n=1 Tax=Gordonia asplenii TaxID=2725283 RepID=A0A848KTV3_9ACTN|nr:hypothetical protein [Gordonia asplenii]NMO00305.1 hypothetical protein [Gordonia asplenii]
MTAVTCRTEYLTARHTWGARGAWIALLAGLIAFLVLGMVDAEPSTRSTIAFAAVAVSLAVAAWGRLGARGAFLLSVADDTVTLGNESERLVEYPTSMLVSVTTRGPAQATSTTGRNLTVAGLKYLVLDFADGSSGVGEQWNFAVVDADPAVRAVLDRLRPRPAAPAPPVSVGAATSAREIVEPVVAARAVRSGDKVDLNKQPGAASTPSTGYDAPSIATAGSDQAAERLWEAAVARHNEILRSYGTYELQPELMLRYPAVTDVTLPPVQDFHDALGDAQALRTERFPADRGVADTYQQKVKLLSRAWVACETNGKRLGTDYLGDDEKAGLDTALKLVDHARGGGSTPQEQASYFRRAHSIVTELRDQGAVHLPPGGVAQLEASARRALR